MKLLRLNKDAKLIVYKTDTVYGLGCRIFDDESIEKIYKIKGKSFNENLSFLVRDIKEIPYYASVSQNQMDKIKELLKKGSHYTFALKKRYDMHSKVSNNEEIGIRVAQTPDLIRLVDYFGPIVTTSANIHGEPAPKRFEDIDKRIIKSVKEYRGRKREVIINGGNCYYGRPSIVYDLVNDRIKRA